MKATQNHAVNGANLSNLCLAPNDSNHHKRVSDDSIYNCQLLRRSSSSSLRLFRSGTVRKQIRHGKDIFARYKPVQIRNFELDV